METIEVGDLSILVMGVHLSLRKQRWDEKLRVANALGARITDQLGERFGGHFRFEVVAIEDGCIKVRLKLIWQTVCDSAERAIIITAALATIATSVPQLIPGRDGEALRCGGIQVEARYDGGDFSPGCHYVTEAGDSLGRLVAPYAGRPHTLNQVMVATFRKNPHAFIDGNMNRLQVGRVLVMPSRSELDQVAAQEANHLVAEHQRRAKG
jgi:FimV-like protein